jgi:hypothetical protein
VETGKQTHRAIGTQNIATTLVPHYIVPPQKRLTKASFVPFAIGLRWKHGKIDEFQRMLTFMRLTKAR